MDSSKRSLPLRNTICLEDFPKNKTCMYLVKLCCSEGDKWVRRRALHLASPVRTSNSRQLQSKSLVSSAASLMLVAEIKGRCGDVQQLVWQPASPDAFPPAPLIQNEFNDLHGQNNTSGTHFIQTPLCCERKTSLRATSECLLTANWSNV